MEKKKLREVVLKNKTSREPLIFKDKTPTTVMIWDGRWREVPICSR